GAVDVNVDGSGKITGDNSTAYNIYLAKLVTPGDPPVIAGHGLSNGEKIIYQVSDASAKISQLTEGGTYYVHYVDAYTIQLATTYCKAVGDIGDHANCNAVAIDVIHISRPSDANATHAIAPAPLGTLTDGFTYTVTRSGSDISLNGQ